MVRIWTAILFGDSAGQAVTDKVGPKEVGAGATVLATPVVIAGAVAGGEAVFVETLSLLMLGLGIAFAIGWVNHLFLWSLFRKPDLDVDPRDLICLDRLLWLQLPIAVYWLVFAAMAAQEPHATVSILPLRVPWVTILILTVIPGVLVTVVATSSKAKKCGLRFVTDVVRKSPPAKFLEGLITPLERVLLLKPLRDWLRGKELGLVSGFSIFLISSLLFFGTQAVYGIAAQRAIRVAVQKVFPGEGVPSQPTYEEVCPGGKEPGAGAPRPWAGALYGLWLGPGGAGGIEGGCTRAARRAKGVRKTWVAEATCEGSLRSVGIARRGRAASLLYQQTARFALAKEREGELVGASPRQDLREGDFYLIETKSGPYVQVRSQKATGSAQVSSEEPRRCEDYTSDNYPYTTVPPGLIRLWLRLSHRELTWPVPDAAGAGEAERFAFIGAESGKLLAHAECGTPTACILTVGERVLETPNLGKVSLETILNVVRR